MFVIFTGTSTTSTNQPITAGRNYTSTANNTTGRDYSSTANNTTPTEVSPTTSLTERYPETTSYSGQFFKINQKII